jgi:predicted anti-sigma-YlaC factor YlaD
MKCRSVQKKLSAYQDRELKHRDQEEISRHLLSCQSCREQYAELERVWQALGEFEEIHPDPWFYRQLVRKIREPREKGLLPTLQHVFQLFRVPVTVSVILAAGLLVGTYLGSILARRDLFPFQTNPAGYSQEALFSSMRVFDPAPPGTFAEGYLRMVSYKENESR